MTKYLQNLFSFIILFLAVCLAIFANWQWPLYEYFGDTSFYRFVWLGIFFVLLDLILEIISKAIKQLNLMAEIMGFAGDIKKMSGEFHAVQKVALSNNSKADYVVVGSSGVWLLTLQGDGGNITFNGDDILQNDRVLKGLLTSSLQKAYSLIAALKDKLNREFKVSPVIVFLTSVANLDTVPKNVRGVYVTSNKDAVSLIENTDVQLIDKHTIEEISGYLHTLK